MISFFRKQKPGNLILELKKTYFIDSIIDNLSNELYIPGKIYVDVNGIPNVNNGLWEIVDNVSNVVYSGSGNETIENVPVGTYTIRFRYNSEEQTLTQRTAKYVVESNISKYLAEDGTITFVGNFTRNSGDINIRVESNDLSFENISSTWSISGTDYNFVGTGNKFISNLMPGVYRITFNSVDRYTTPDSREFRIESNEVKEVIGRYDKSYNDNESV